MPKDNTTTHAPPPAVPAEVLQQLNYDVQHSPLGVIEWDAQWRIIRWAGQSEHIFGYTAEDIQNMAWDEWRFVHDEDVERVTQICDNLAKGLEKHNLCQNRSYTKDGRVVHCEWYNSARHDEQGRFTGSFSLVNDVTDRETRAHQLRVQQAELRESQRLAKLVSWSFSLDHPEIHWSDQVYELFHLQPNEPAPKVEDLLAHATAESRRLIDTQYQRVLETGEACELDTTLIWPSGQVAHYHTHILPIFNAQGEVSGMRGATQDVTDLRRIEAELAESESRLRLLADNTRDMIALYDSDSRFLFVTPSIKAILGYEPEEVIGHTAEGVLPPDTYLNLTKPRMAKLFAGEPVPPVTYHANHKDGHQVWLEVNCNSIKGSDGKVSHVVACARDITERIRLQSEARVHELAHLARLATIGEMSTSIAHEVNQPLAAIAMLTKAYEPMLQAGTVDGETILSLLQQIREETLRAGEIVHRVKDMARKRTHRPEKHSVQQLLASAIATAEPTAKHHGCALEFTPPAEDFFVRVDPVEIQQVLLNLLVNAVDAVQDLPSGQRKIHLHAAALGSNVDIQVRDEGHGIAEDMINEVFNPFFTTKENGLGLGLSISYNIVENHGGRIYAKPHPPQGTCFHIELPLCASDP